MRDEDPVLRVLCADDHRDTADTLVVLLQIAGLDATASTTAPPPWPALWRLIRTFSSSTSPCRD